MTCMDEYMKSQLPGSVYSFAHSDTPPILFSAVEPSTVEVAENCKERRGERRRLGKAAILRLRR